MLACSSVKSDLRSSLLLSLSFLPINIKSFGTVKPLICVSGILSASRYIRDPNITVPHVLNACVGFSTSLLRLYYDYPVQDISAGYLSAPDFDIDILVVAGKDGEVSQ